MAMVCGLDLHRGQITFDALVVESGEVWRGRVWQPDRERFRRWLRDEVTRRAQGGPVALAVEGCTGWRYVVEEITAAGFEAHLAEPADTQAARGRKHRAKTDRTDARLLRELLVAGRAAGVVDPARPTVLEWRERVRLYKSLVDQRTMWCQRIHAELYQHGVAVPEGAIRSAATRALAGRRERCSCRRRPGSGSAVGYQMIDATDTEALPLKRELATLRCPPAGVSGLGRRAVRDRRADRGGGVVRARRLPTVLAAPNKWCVTPAWTSPSTASDRRRAGGYPVPPRTRDAALGALRSGEELVASTQSRPRSTTRRSRNVTTARSPRSPSPASSRGAATTSCATSTPTSSTPYPT